jgi:hypothetical protein
MNTELVKPSKAIKGSTAAVRLHADTLNRAWQIYLGQIKRAETEYVERIKRAAEMFVDAAPTDSKPADANGQAEPMQEEAKAPEAAQ